MRKFFNRFLIIFLSVSVIFCFLGCSDLLSKIGFPEIGSSGSGSSSGGGSSSSLTIDFNGATLDGKSSKKFTSEEIAPYVGMDIEEALYELDFGIENLKKDGFALSGFTKKKDGDDYVDLLPPFGTIYARWTNGGSSGEISGETVLVAFDLNGGYILDDEGNEVSYIEKYLSEETWLDTVGLTPYRNGYTFVGWTVVRDGSEVISQVNEIPSSTNRIVYARWQDNLSLFVNGDIVGDFTVDETGKEKAQPLNYLGDGIYTYQFTYNSNLMNAWGTHGTHGSNWGRFKLRPLAGDWAVSYGVWEGTLEVNGGSLQVFQLSGSYDIYISNLQDGVTYTIHVQVTNSGDCYVRIYTADEGNSGGGDISEPENPPEEEQQWLTVGDGFRVYYSDSLKTYSLWCEEGYTYTVDWYDGCNRTDYLNKLLSMNGIYGNTVDIEVSVNSPYDVVTNRVDTGPYSFDANYTGIYTICVEPYYSSGYGYFAISVDCQ